MKILITGATGLIGKELGKCLVSAGHEIVAISRSKQNAFLGLPYPAAIFEWPSVKSPFPMAALEGVDGIVHLMGENLAEHRWSDSFKQKLSESRVESTRALVDAVKRYQADGHQQLKVWVQGSAVGYYAETDVDEVHDESSRKGSNFLSQLCEKWEAEVEPLRKSIRSVIVRTGVVFSHQGGTFTKLFTPLKNGLGGRLGNGLQKMSLIHLTDVVGFIKHALEHENVEGVVNLTCNEPVSQKDLCEKMCGALYLREGPAMPAFALKIALGEMASIVLESQAVISKRMKELGFNLQYPDVNSVLAEVTSWYLHPIRARESALIEFTEQYFDKPLEEVFSFFADAQNLEKITPQWLHFKVKELSTLSLQEGTKIHYDLKIHGVPVKWVTDITRWERPTLFVDQQLQGPYELWYHEHAFRTMGKGTLMQDWVRYQLPLGKLGQWVGGMKVRADVDAIFRYRREMMAKDF